MIAPTEKASSPNIGIIRPMNIGVQKNASIPEMKMINPMTEICHHRTGTSQITSEGLFIYLLLFL
jgi:hypothetical protein